MRELASARRLTRLKIEIRNMRRLAVALMTIVLTCEGACTAFINDYTDWQALGEDLAPSKFSA
jgi:hypothetical protein